MQNDGWFEGADGQRLFERSWLPADAAKATVIILHGYAEHCGRYEYAAEALAKAGYAVRAYDQRGHGRSEGDRALVRSIDDYLDDLDVFVARVRAEIGADAPRFILGHSMGGQIVALHAIERRPDVRGVMLSGAALGGSGKFGLREWFIVAVGQLLPKWGVLTLDAATVSRDPDVVRRYDEDPLVYRGKMKAGLLSSLLRGGRRVARGMASMAYPLLVMHGTADALVPSGGSSRLHETASSDDKTLKLYDGLYHEILNEPERDAVIADVVGWLDARCGRDASGGHS